jgi:hypothetical protein
MGWLPLFLLFSKRVSLNIASGVSVGTYSCTIVIMYLFLALQKIITFRAKLGEKVTRDASSQQGGFPSLQEYCHYQSTHSILQNADAVDASMGRRQSSEQPP